MGKVVRNREEKIRDEWIVVEKGKKGSKEKSMKPYYIVGVSSSSCHM